MPEIASPRTTAPTNKRRRVGRLPNVSKANALAAIDTMIEAATKPGSW